jgi:hypothetical protein
MKTLIVIQMSEQRATHNALLDSGATESFLHLRVVNELKLPTYKLNHPQKVHNVNRMDNRLGEVTKEV